MILHLQEWLNVLLRWVHLIAGISWIGSSFYFMWLDASLTPPHPSRTGVEGELWMVHSGGFYQVEKRKITADQMPKTLHWFKWEAFFTWLSGIFLLSLIYYMTGGVYLLDSHVSSITPGLASALGIGLIVLSWVGYDLLWKSSFSKKHSTLSVLICLLDLVVITYGLCHVLSGRAAFIHVGAIFGTVMVLNVWMRILPAQQKMIDATRVGKIPDYSLGAAAKVRSVHNSYMTFPVLLIMLSNHYPMTYGHPLNWVVLLLLIVLGAGVRYLMISKSPKKNWAYIPTLGALFSVILMTGPSLSLAPPTEKKVTFTQAQEVVTRRCLSCHSQAPTDDVFKAPPNGVTFDTPDRMVNFAERIKFRVVTSKTMPLGNKSQITQEERDLLGTWIDQGAKIQ